MDKDTMATTLGQRGVMTLPKKIRDAYHLRAGDQVTILDLGGVFLMTPQRSEIDALADRLAGALGETGASLETMLNTVREERERYGKGP